MIIFPVPHLLNLQEMLSLCGLKAPHKLSTSTTWRTVGLLIATRQSVTSKAKGRVFVLDLKRPSNGIATEP